MQHRMLATIAAVAAVFGTMLSAVPAQAVPTSSPIVASSLRPGMVSVTGADGVIRSFTRDDLNETGVAGMSGTLDTASSDTIAISADGQSATVVSAAGDVLLSLSAPELGEGDTAIAAKIVRVGQHLVITPADARTRSMCASSAWGNVIVNIGMAGVCAMLGVGTIVGGVVCTAALIAANAAIDWDSSC
ncbi:MAG TPA: hypothetical protein VNJ54_11260 [Plantibacter sp.]|uniref:hypothetical protein n=1 Tax=unclassified Plantibacter TaxID=2624265 RepID=UPI002CC80CB0|nr:hypothetical protein [Plantibacter sp.]